LRKLRTLAEGNSLNPGKNGILGKSRLQGSDRYGFRARGAAGDSLSKILQFDILHPGVLPWNGRKWRNHPHIVGMSVGGVFLLLSGQDD